MLKFLERYSILILTLKQYYEEILHHPCFIDEKMETQTDKRLNQGSK